ncbi:unnamed protein product [Mycena citricolor]|uniref:SET domain-containing protein n=1 Tax=Mycena citricolor TaxID=2018698 RepID=A0AAD2Q419_9AGAR|nr:unnamed protein product [Mycena citricolor]
MDVPGLFVESHQGALHPASKPTGSVRFAAGEILGRLNNASTGPRAYSTVQCGPGDEDNVELNSNLVYVNHSCDPNAVFDLSSTDPTRWHLRALKDIMPGNTITYFYPSTEWDMAQAFDCDCKTVECLGRIQGAKYLSRSELIKRGWISPWILRLCDERDSELLKL